jgi:hypothetical protein
MWTQIGHRFSTGQSMKKPATSLQQDAVNTATHVEMLPSFGNIDIANLRSWVIGPLCRV